MSAEKATKTPANLGHTKSKCAAKTSESRFTERDLDLWENDASNLMGDEGFRQRAREGLYRYLQGKHLTPEQAYPMPSHLAQRAEYAQWLASRSLNAIRA